MASVFPEYKYFDLIYGRNVRRDRLLKLRSKSLRPVADAFIRNVSRMDSFSVFPAAVAAEALQEQLWRDCAIFKVTGALSARRKKPFSKRTEIAIQREVIRLANAERSRFIHGKVIISDKIKRGADHISEMLKHEIGAMQSMEAILYSIVIETWMAFETLAADLWFAALDHGPSGWRNRTLLKSNKFKKGPENETVIDPAQMNDPAQKFGSALRDADKISFQKLRLIIFWYTTAFGKEVLPIFKEDPHLTALSAVRNVIIHKAGHADATYINAVKDFPTLSSVELGKQIQLDGKIARELQNAALLIGGNLVLYVDDKLTPLA